MRAVRQLVLLVIVVGIGLRVFGVPAGSSLLWIAVAAEAALVSLVLLGLMRIWRARARAPEGEAGTRGWDALREILREGLPERIAEAVLSEARVLVAGGKSVVSRPLAKLEVRPGWRRFGAMETSSYGNIVAMLLLLIVVEAPGVHLILGAVMEDTTLRAVIRAVLLGSSIYLGIWLLGDLRLLRETPGVSLGDDALNVEFGLRVQGTVALDDVVGARVLDGYDPRSPDASRAIRISPLPQPNVRVRLRSPVSMRGIVGVPLRGEVLDMYVDDPAGLVSAIEATLATSRHEVRDGDAIERLSP